MQAFDPISERLLQRQRGPAQTLDPISEKLIAMRPQPGPPIDEQAALAKQAAFAEQARQTNPRLYQNITGQTHGPGHDYEAGGVSPDVAVKAEFAAPLADVLTFGYARGGQTVSELPPPQSVEEARARGIASVGGNVASIIVPSGPLKIADRAGKLLGGAARGVSQSVGIGRAGQAVAGWLGGAAGAISGFTAASNVPALVETPTEAARQAALAPIRFPADVAAAVPQVARVAADVPRETPQLTPEETLEGIRSGVTPLVMGGLAARGGIEGVRRGLAAQAGPPPETPIAPPMPPGLPPPPTRGLLEYKPTRYGSPPPANRMLPPPEATPRDVTATARVRPVPPAEQAAPLTTTARVVQPSSVPPPPLPMESLRERLAAEQVSRQSVPSQQEASPSTLVAPSPQTPTRPAPQFPDAVLFDAESPTAGLQAIYDRARKDQQAMPSGGVAEKKIKKWIEASAREETIRSIADDIADSPTDPIIDDFFNRVYPRLDKSAQDQFNRRVEKHTGMRPGDTAYVDAQGKPHEYKSVDDIVRDAVGGKERSANMDSSDRGLLATMQLMNERMAKLRTIDEPQPRLPSPQQVQQQPVSEQQAKPTFIVHEGKIARVVSWDGDTPTIIYPGKEGGMIPDGGGPYRYRLTGTFRPASQADFDARLKRRISIEAKQDIGSWRDQFVKQEVPTAAQPQGVTNARQVSQAEEVHGNVQQPEGPRQGQRQVPAGQGGEGVRAKGQEIVPKPTDEPGKPGPGRYYGSDDDPLLSYFMRRRGPERPKYGELRTVGRNVETIGGEAGRKIVNQVKDFYDAAARNEGSLVSPLTRAAYELKLSDRDMREAADIAYGYKSSGTPQQERAAQYLRAAMRASGRMLERARVTTTSGKPVRSLADWSPNLIENPEYRRAIIQGIGPKFDEVRNLVIKALADKNLSYVKGELVKAEGPRTHEALFDQAGRFLRDRRDATIGGQKQRNESNPSTAGPPAAVGELGISPTQYHRLVKWPRHMLAENLWDASERHFKDVARTAARHSTFGSAGVSTKLIESYYKHAVREFADQTRMDPEKAHRNAESFLKVLLADPTRRPDLIAAPAEGGMLTDILRAGRGVTSLITIGIGSPYAMGLNLLYGTQSSGPRFGYGRAIAGIARESPALLRSVLGRFGRSIPVSKTYFDAIGAGALTDQTALLKAIHEAPLPERIRNFLSGGFTATEAVIRSGVAKAGLDWGEAALKKLRKEPLVWDTREGRQLMEMLRIDKTQLDELVKRGSLTDGERNKLMRAAVTLTQPTTRSYDVPRKFQAGEIWKTVLQFKAAAYKQMDATIGYALREAKMGEYRPMARYLVGGLALGLTGAMFRSILAGRGLPKTQDDRISAFWNAVGDMLGLIETPLDLVEQTAKGKSGQDVASRLLPPSLSVPMNVAVRGAQAVGNLAQGDTQQAGRRARQAIRSASGLRTIDTALTATGALDPIDWASDQTTKNIPFTPATNRWSDARDRFNSAFSGFSAVRKAYRENRKSPPELREKSASELLRAQLSSGMTTQEAAALWSAIGNGVARAKRMEERMRLTAERVMESKSDTLLKQLDKEAGELADLYDRLTKAIETERRKKAG